MCSFVIFANKTFICNSYSLPRKSLLQFVQYRCQTNWLTCKTIYVSLFATNNMHCTTNMKFVALSAILQWIFACDVVFKDSSIAGRCDFKLELSNVLTVFLWRRPLVMWMLNLRWFVIVSVRRRKNR